ncbi:TfoX/Sxy family protein [Actinoplanes sp. NPDC051470]|uniref:TfoX/Sxy family protein n=1 Tax=Actinoplanes sp. NPDC051470 TaxID=3157224 RepID=UPI00341DDD36
MAIDHEAAERGDKRLEALADPYLQRPGVDWGRMFSTIGLRVRGKIFGLVNHAGNLMVKIPATRADTLESTGAATRMTMAGKIMREWVEMPYDAGEEAWRTLLDEAYTYLEEITPRS